MRISMYSCMETCGQEKECGNRYCSANSRYIPPTPKKRHFQYTPRFRHVKSYYAPIEDEE